MWHVTSDMWHVTYGRGWVFSQHFSIPPLTVWDRQCLDGFKQKGQWLNQWINESMSDGGDSISRTSRTAPGYPRTVKNRNKGKFCAPLFLPATFLKWLAKFNVTIDIYELPYSKLNCFLYFHNPIIWPEGQGWLPTLPSSYRTNQISRVKDWKTLRTDKLKKKMIK